MKYVLLCLLLLEGCATKPPAVERADCPPAKAFKDFETAYVAAYSVRRLAAFEKLVEGDSIVWDGVVIDVSPTGTFVRVASQSSGQGVEAAVFLDSGYVPATLREGDKVRVTGRIESVSVLSVIVRGKICSQGAAK